MRRRIWALGVVVLLVLVGACSSGGHRPDPSTSSSVAAPTTSTAPVAPNPYVVPPVITPAYVDAVFKVLNHIYGDATRELYSANGVDATVRLDLRALFSDPLYAQELVNAAASLSIGRTELRNPIGDVVTTVNQVVSQSSRCIFVETVSDFSAVNLRPGSAGSEYWELTTKDPSNDPQHINTTPWALSFNADFVNKTVVPDQCVG